MMKRIAQRTLALVFLGAAIAAAIPIRFADAAAAGATSYDAVMSDWDVTLTSCSSGPCGWLITTSCNVANAATAECKCLSEIIGERAYCDGTCPEGTNFTCKYRQGGSICNPKTIAANLGPCDCSCESF